MARCERLHCAVGWVRELGLLLAFNRQLSYCLGEVMPDCWRTPSTCVIRKLLTYSMIDTVQVPTEVRQLVTPRRGRNLEHDGVLEDATSKGQTVCI